MSLYLSPIELNWDELSRRIRQRPDEPQTLQQLEAAILEEWANIPMDLVHRYIRSTNEKQR